uniref:EGF-like domain-containing protein n=1 Tax=Gongylonema pulchrum TaxID=637853 RepID=A0A183D1V9_9BILA
LPSQDADCHNGGVQCGKNEECIRGNNNAYHVSQLFSFPEEIVLPSGARIELQLLQCECTLGYERNLQSGECTAPGSCNPSAPNPCDIRKREKCLLHSTGRYYTCQCAAHEKRHPVTGICLQDECTSGAHDCDKNARCIDTDDGFLCACRNGFLDQSPDPVNKPGRVCVAEKNECLDGTHKCSPNAICTDTVQGYICRCKPGYVDFSPNPHSFGGIVCKQVVNECQNPSLNTCHKDAICIDTADSYKCICKTGYTDLDELRNPGRNCQKGELGYYFLKNSFANSCSMNFAFYYYLINVALRSNISP